MIVPAAAQGEARELKRKLLGARQPSLQVRCGWQPVGQPDWCRAFRLRASAVEGDAGPGFAVELGQRLAARPEAGLEQLGFKGRRLAQMAADIPEIRGLVDQVL